MFIIKVQIKSEKNAELLALTIFIPKKGKAVKKLLITAVLAASALFAGTATAGTGYIPYFAAIQSGTWCAYVSNVSNVDVSVTVRAYSGLGSVFSGPTHNVDRTVAGEFNVPFNLKPIGLTH